VRTARTSHPRQSKKLDAGDVAPGGPNDSVVAVAREAANGVFVCLLESGDLEERKLEETHPALVNFHHETAAAFEADAEGLEKIVDDRKTASRVEYLCVLNDESSVWMTVPEGNKALEKYLARKDIGARGPEIIKDLEDWVKSDFIDE
jgi:hypothetical protein